MTNREENMEAKVLRLMTKEIIICKVQQPDNTNFWIIEDPFEIRSFMNPNSGDYNSTLIDWLQFSSENETKIAVADILTCNVPEGEVLEHYLAIVKRKKIGTEIVKDEALDLIDKVKDAKDPDVTFEDYMEILNGNKVFH